MSIKNTPWIFDGSHVVDSTNTVVAVEGIAQPHGYTPPEDSSWDHARLFAAAPDLLEACKQAKKYLEPDLVEPGRTIFWRLVSAIAKTEGTED